MKKISQYNIDKSLVGKRYGNITLLEKLHQGYFKCKCDCGKIFNKSLRTILSSKHKSCGCFNMCIEPLFKQYKREYISFMAMKQRCYNPNAHKYCNYGGRGITVCDRWLGSEGFKNFLKDMGKRPLGMSLDRIETNGNYEPFNCKWSTQKEQTNNTRATRKFEYKGKLLPLTIICEKHGINYNMVRNRLDKGWNFKDAISIPKDTKYNKRAATWKKAI
jgi:hypothetical protein